MTVQRPHNSGQGRRFGTFALVSNDCRGASSRARSQFRLGAWCFRFAFCLVRLYCPRMALKLVSLLGVVVLVGVAWLCSLDRKKFPWRAVGWGLGLQFLFAVL